MTFEYVAKYDSELLRGHDAPETPRPWDLKNFILNFSGKERFLLDIGCGTSFKLIPLASHFNTVIGLDLSADMVFSSHKNIQGKNINNISIVMARNEALPFTEKKFDVITCMLSRCTASEAHRVLKSTGVLIIEYPGCEDKKEFKELFGKDSDGWRGQFINYKRDEFIDIFYKTYKRYFNYIEIKNGFWNTYYTSNGIIELLKYTPTIRNFDLVKDKKALEFAIETFMTPHGIRLKQNRILMYATNDHKNS